MAKPELALLLALQLISATSVGQVASRTFADEDGSFLSTGNHPGQFLDEPDAQFFGVLKSAHVNELPLTFDDAVDAAAVIGRGYIVDVLPGRTITSTRREALRVSTILLKIQTLKIEKGGYEGFFFVEYALDWSNVVRLKETLYTGEVLFLLGPAVQYGRPLAAEAIVSDEAVRELGEAPIYSQALESGLFVMSRSGQLTSAIDFSQDFGDLYTQMRSLDQLAAHVRELSSSD